MKPSLITFLCLLLFNQYSSGQNTAQEYIEAHKEWAIDAMHEYGIPASVILAIAMHESANGSSKVAIYLNNHFGIRGQNNSKQIRSSYKGYANIKDSYNDFINYLKTGKKFSVLFGKYPSYDYHSWAYGIMRGGYASSRTWAAHIIALIKKHELFTLDERPEGYVEPVVSTPLTTSSVAQTTHTVKKGDTLGAIAKRYKTTIKGLKVKNGLSTDKLKVGQRLKI